MHGENNRGRSWLFAVAVAIVLGAPVADSYGQLATIRGRVTDSVARPLPGASVALTDEDGTGTGTLTDAGGEFFLSRIRPGTFILQVSFVGFSTVTDTLDLGFDDTIVYDVSLSEAEVALDEVIVEESRGVDRRSTAGLEVVRPSALARVPMPDVTYDLAGYLLTLPGFVSTGDRGGQLFVRGGTSTQNLVLVDGIPVFQPFHLIGFYSAFPADIISFAEVYAGGFGARYGGRISSVIDVNTTNGNKTSASGSVSIAPFIGSARFEVPIEKDKVSLVGSFRQSLIKAVSPALLGEELPFKFGDRFVKLHAFLNQTSSLSITGIQTYDEGTLGSGQNARPSSWRNTGGGFRYTFLPAEEAVLSQFAAHYSRMVSTYQLSETVRQEADVDAFTMEMMFAYLLRKSRIQVGLFGNLNNFHYDLGRDSRDVNVGVTSGGGYVDTQFEVSPTFRIEPGVRYEVFARGIKGSIAPRVRAMWLPFGSASRHQWSVAWGKYHQQIVGLNNEQDVSDVFTIWAPSPPNRDVPEATHIILGLQQRVTRWLEVSAEAYSKRMHNLAFPVYSSRPSDVLGFSGVEGHARGIDFKTEVSRRSFFATVGYTLSEVSYTWDDSGGSFIRGVESVEAGLSGSFNPPHDRRHQLNTAFQVTRGNTRLSLRWQLGSGLPFTQINGYYQGIEVSPLDNTHLTDVGSPLVSRAERFGARMPAYHRLDASLERDFVATRTTTTVQAGLINAYDRDNILEYNFFTGERINQLPLIPSVGVKVHFR